MIESDEKKTTTQQQIELTKDGKIEYRLKSDNNMVKGLYGRTQETASGKDRLSLGISFPLPVKVTKSIGLSFTAENGTVTASIDIQQCLKALSELTPTKVDDIALKNFGSALTMLLGTMAFKKEL